MRISFKSLLWLWAGLLLLVGGLFLTAYTKFKPETFVSLLNQQLQRNYPGSKLEVSKVEQSFSLDFNLSLSGLTLKRGDSLLGSAGEIQLKVPWWVLLFNKGNAQINLKQLVIYIDSESPSATNSANDVKDEKIRVSVPGYISEAHYTLRAKDIEIREVNGPRRFFKLSKLLVREFQYGKNSAFEMNIPIHINHRNANYNSELWLFGDVTPEPKLWRINYRGEFKTEETTDRFQFEDLVIDGKAAFNPAQLDLSSNLNLLMENEIIGSGSASARYGELNLTIDLTKLPLSYLSLIGEELKNPYWKKLEGHAEGVVMFSKSFGQDSSKINGKLSFNGFLSLAPQSKFQGKWQLGFENSKWDTSFISPKGEVSFFRRAILDFNEGTMTQFTEELGFSGVDVKDVLPTLVNLNQLQKMVPGEYFNTLVSFKKCLVTDKSLEGTLRYGVSPDQKFYQSDLAVQDGKMKLNFQQKTMKNSLDLEFIKFPWLSSLDILNPFFNAMEGILNGKVEGRWISPTEGNWLLNLGATALKDAKGEWPDLVKKAWSYFEIDSHAFPDQNWNLFITNKSLKVNSVMLNSLEPAKLTGELNYTIGEKSHLTLAYPKNKKWRAVSKEISDLIWIKE